MLSARFLDSGTYYDEISKIMVRLTWDTRDECWRLWKSVDGEWERVPGEDLGGDKSDDGIEKVVKQSWAAYEEMVDAASRKRHGLEG